MVKINQPVSAAWSRAAERAAQDRAAGRIPERIGCKRYRVASSTGGDAHLVTIGSVVNLQATCDCLAGQRGIPCRHAAAALCEAARYIARCERLRRASAPATAAPATALADVDVYGDFGTARQGAAEIDRKMARFSRV